MPQSWPWVRAVTTVTPVVKQLIASLMFTPCFLNCFYKNARASCAATRPSSVGITHTSMALLSV
jgi:hypothetical protein